MGRCRALHNGQLFEEAYLEPGDLLQLGEQMLFLCSWRPAWLDGASNAASFAFGDADPHGMVGESTSIHALRRQVHEAALGNQHVLITGPTGTGKELVARAIHQRSRGNRPLVARNAATLPEGVIDAELFGNAKNYPNAGMLERPGLIGQADESTLFLDEFGELPISLQVHLLRVLDEGEYQRLGESKSRTSSFRLVAATNRPLSAIRRDVLARFKVQIALPELNARREDIPLLARHSLTRTRGANPRQLPMGFIARLAGHDFEANVRELDSLVARFVASQSYDWPEVWASEAPSASVAGGDVPAVILERSQVEACLNEHGWVQEKVWRALNLTSRHALARLIKRYDLTPP